MQASSIPTKFPLAWGADAGVSYIRPIPVASQIGITGGAASFTDGFPPLCFAPVGSGGIPPFGQDMNGILNEISLWSQWQQAGASVPYDSAFSTAIGGYPKGAILANASTVGSFWISTVDNNTSDPDTGGANWIGYSPIGVTRIVTASGAFTSNLSDQSVGLLRTSAPAPSSTTLPSFTAGQSIWYEDLEGNFNAYPLTVSPPAGQTIAQATSIVLNVNRQCARFKYYGSNVWSVKI
jgi:hypothetical protein